MVKKAAEYHRRASHYHGRAADLHREAAEKQEVGETDVALREASVATGHGIHGLRLGEKAISAQIEHLHLLMREASHRSTNILALVQAIARQTAAGHPPEDFLKRFNDRVAALAANQDLLTRYGWRGVDLEDLVRTQLAHFVDLIGSRITLHGPKLCLNAATSEAIGLAIHELATNAGKYGALSAETGRIDVRWGVDRGAFELKWTESKGPPVSSPKRHGFGYTIITALVRAAVGGDTGLDYEPSGVTWSLSAPVGNVLETCAENQ
jgi:two-component sensor histidine kinase